MEQDPVFEKISRGDKQTFEFVFREYFKGLCLFAISYVKDAEQAREIVQELFCHLWERKGQLVIHTSLKAYLYRSVRNTCLNFLKHEQVKSRSHRYILLHTENEFAEVDEHMHSSELDGAFLKSFQEMPEKTREIFEMVRFQGLKYREVADKLNISQKTVEAHITSALKYLRNALKDYIVVILFGISQYF